MSAAAGGVVRYEVDGRKARITLTRPQAMNALDTQLVAALNDAFDEANRNDEVLVVILTGEGGRAFCAGADLKEMAARDAPGQAPMFDGDDPITPLAGACAKPVIAAIDGYALAGGFELALTCDIRIATEQSTFGLPEPKRSLLGGYGLHHLSRMIPLGEAMLMQLSGTSIGAQRAYQIGLIQGIEPDRAALFRKVDALADEIASCAPLAVRAIKKIVMAGRDKPVESSYAFARPIEQAIYASEDRLEGPKAFAEKRAPRWKSR
jgi:enoyl-CoA hydratase/carnithine racemase